jgi:hypothetical protein
MFLLVAGSLFMDLGCGGGGGGTSPSGGSNGGSPTTYSASGLITSNSGVGVPGVTLSLTGQATASTSTDSNGNFTFSGLGSGAYTLTPTFGNCGFNPASTSFTIASTGSTGRNFVATFPSTDFVNTYMTTLHAQTISQFLTDEDALGRQLSASGNYGSGLHYSLSKTDYENHIQAFLNSSLAYIQSASQTMPIDKNAIIQLLNSQKANDKAYSVTYYTGVNWQGSALVVSTITTGISTDLDNMYSLVISQVQVL